MYNGLFNWWVQSVMPVVFDDSLSYYEVLSKLTKYIEGLTGDVAQIEKILGTIEGIEDVTEFTRFLESISNEIGELSNLSTSNKNNLVSAINEVAQKANQAYVKPSGGIPESDLSQGVKDKLNSGGESGTSVSYIINNKTLKTAPNNNSPAELGLGTYSVPEGGIPWDTLSEDVQNRIEAGGGGTGGTKDYTDLNNKPQINGHTLNAGNNTLENLGIGTYNKPVTGIPESDLSEEVQNKLNTSGGIAGSESDFVATKDYEAGELFYINGVLYKAKNKILSGTSLVPGNNIEETDINVELESINNKIDAMASGEGLDSWSLVYNITIASTDNTYHNFFEYVALTGGESYLFIITPTIQTLVYDRGYIIRCLKRDGTIVKTETVNDRTNYENQYRFTFTPNETGEYYFTVQLYTSGGDTNAGAKLKIELEYTQSQGMTELWTKVNAASSVVSDVDALETLVRQQKDQLDNLKSTIDVNPPGLKTITGFSELITYQGYVQPNGTFRDTQQGWVRTDYIETVPGAHIVASLRGYDIFPIVAFYDETKTYMESASIISQTQSVVSVNTYVPEGVKYAIFVSQTNYDDREFSIEVPMTIGENVAILNAKSDIYDNTIMQIPALENRVNNLEEATTVSGYYVDITGFENVPTEAGWIDTDGNFRPAASGWIHTDYIQTAPGAHVSASLQGYLNYPLVAYYDSEKHFLSDVSIPSDTQAIVNVDSTVPEGVTYVAFLSQTAYAGRTFTIGTPASISQALDIVASDLYSFKGLKVLCMGDSLTAGIDGTNTRLLHNYPYFMREICLKDCVIDNKGVPGSTTRTYWNNNMDALTLDNTIDYVLMMWGTNGDLMSNTLATDVEPYDDYNDYADTGVGDFCKIIEYVMEQTQNSAQIILLTPPYNGNTSINDRVYAAQSVVEAIAERYNLPVIDMFKCGIGKFNYQTYMPIDSVHFSETGYRWIGTYIGSCLKSVSAKRV